MGFSGSRFRYPANVSYRCVPVDRGRTSHAKAYVVTRHRAPVHGVIGCDRSGLTLGVLGINNELMLARSADLCQLYGGDELYEVLAHA